MAASPPIRPGVPASDATLAALCDRVALSLDAGIDIRRVWRSESRRLGGRAAAAAGRVADAIDAGSALDEALALASPVFPPLLVEMARVAERTGAAPEVFRRLHQHYERRVARSREFRSAIAWPAIQLAIAAVVVAVVIALGGMLRDPQGGPLDLIGIGLTGTEGVITYLNVLFAIVLAFGVGRLLLKRQPAAGAWLRGVLTRLPLIGGCLRKIALARVAWALRLLMDVDLDVRRVAKLALRATENDAFIRHEAGVVSVIEQGRPLSEALAPTGEFPQAFLDMLEVAEESGQIVEAMDRLSRRYDEEAEQAVALLTRAAAFAVWAAVATVIITLIFRLFAFYQGVLNGALGGL